MFQDISRDEDDRKSLGSADIVKSQIESQQQSSVSSGPQQNFL